MKFKKFVKKNFTSIVLCLIFAIGLGLICYPTFANWWNSWNAAHVSAGYEQAVENMSSSEREEMYAAAEEYNKELLTDPNRFTPSTEKSEQYNSILDVSGTGVIGSISIPAVKIDLPIYHGTSDTVLAVGAGHLEGSSLPIGGLGTHAVITGHRGLPSAKLFTDLDHVVEGDYVVINVLNEKRTYQVDTIRIVLPSEVSSLTIDPEKDQVTLVTCTPYGVNTHRMLITGHRVENPKEFELTREANQINSKMVALFIAIPLLVILFVWLMWSDRKKKNIGKEVDEDEE